MPEILTLANGARHIRFTDDRDLGFVDDRCFVTLPPGFAAEVIPDALIHANREAEDATAPRWYRTPVNRWWAWYRARAAAAAP